LSIPLRQWYLELDLIIKKKIRKYGISSLYYHNETTRRKVTRSPAVPPRHTFSAIFKHIDIEKGRAIYDSAFAHFVLGS
jgi:hypothetical protein